MAVRTLTLTVNSTKDIYFSLNDRTEATNVLTTGNIKIFLSASGTGAFTAFTDFTLSGATLKTATIVPNTAFAEADVIRVALDDGTDTSNRVFADFSTAFTDGTGTIVYQTPATAGNYTVNNKAVNDVATLFNSDAFIASNIPAAANCKMEFSKKYLVKFVNTKYNLTVTLKDSDNNNVSNGGYELVYSES